MCIRSHAAMNSLTDVDVTSQVPMAIPGANCLTIPEMPSVAKRAIPVRHDSAIAATALAAPYNVRYVIAERKW